LVAILISELAGRITIRPIIELILQRFWERQAGEFAGRVHRQAFADGVEKFVNCG